MKIPTLKIGKKEIFKPKWTPCNCYKEGRTEYFRKVIHIGKIRISIFVEN